jgi:hypothetical protein
VIGDARLQIFGHAKVERHKVAVGEPFDEGVIAGDSVNARCRRVFDEIIRVCCARFSESTRRRESNAKSCE